MQIKLLKFIKIIMFLIITINIFLIISNISRVEALGIDVTENVNDWEPIPNGSNEKLQNKAGVILGLITMVGTVISVVTLSLIGLKFMLGSVEDKANYNQALLPWVIGAIILFGASTIPSIVYNVINSSVTSTDYAQMGTEDGNSFANYNYTNRNAIQQEIQKVQGYFKTNIFPQPKSRAEIKNQENLKSYWSGYITGLKSGQAY